MNPNSVDSFKSLSRIAGAVSEKWVEANLYCAVCSSPQLSPTPINAKAVDFICPSCRAEYQLKARRRWTEGRIADAAYHPMMARINAGQSPHLLVMHYSPAWKVERLLLVPKFFFTASAIHMRNPLGETARRAGWVGCDILLSRIAVDGRIDIVRDGKADAPSSVRNRYQQLIPLQAKLAQRDATSKGWMLDVLACIRQLNETFTLEEVYQFVPHLTTLHPDNNFVKDKIRQQLQVLRDANFVEFLERGHYRMRPVTAEESKL